MSETLAETLAKVEADGPGSAELLTLLVRLSYAQGIQAARLAGANRTLDDQEARLKRIEETAVARIAELEATNASLRESLRVTMELLGNIRQVCQRHGWEEPNGVPALQWLDFKLADGWAAGWPSVN